MHAVRREVVHVEVERGCVVGELHEVARSRVRRRVVEKIDERDACKHPAATRRARRDRRGFETTGQRKEAVGVLGLEGDLGAVVVEECQDRRAHGPDRSAASAHSLPAVHAVTTVDGEIAWREHPDPAPGEGELLVAVRAAGLNGADMLQRKGLYPAPPGSPDDIPGMELAGEVVAVGPNVTRFATGDRVMAIVGGGGQAELALVHERVALPVPDQMTWAEAGGFPEVFTTAHDALFTQCGLTIGDAVVVHGAAGGVGIAGVQLAACAGARVTATVRNPDLRDGVAAIGRACGDVDVCAPDEFAARGPFDVVLELVGAPNVPDDLEALAVGGRIVVVGVGNGASATVNLLTLMARRARILASTLRARPLEGKAATARAVEHSVLPLVESGRVRVPVAEEFAMADASAAYERFEVGGKLGKLVLVVGI